MYLKTRGPPTDHRPTDRPTPPVGIVKTLRASLPLNEDIASVSDRKPFPELHEIFMLLRGNKRQRQTQHAHCNTNPPPWLPYAVRIAPAKS